MIEYKKGKDIKVPFDCLWHYYTRKFEGRYIQRSNPKEILVYENKIYTWEVDNKGEFKPEDFDKF